VNADPTQIPKSDAASETSAPGARRSDDRSWHWILLIGATATLIAGWTADVASDGSLTFSAAPSLKVPVICLVRRFSGIPCPACGLTRSATHLLHGRLWDSLATHRLGWLVLLVVAFQIPYRAWRLTGRSSWLDDRRVEDVLLTGFFLLLAINWLLPGR
jgi:Protein of unknown function (DUF2752)